VTVSVIIALSLVLSKANAQGDAASPLRFNQDIRPLLSSACYRCHGFDAKTREADLRLDTEEGALAVRDSGRPAIAPGKLDESLIWERIHSADPDLVMPPPSSNRKLSPAEIETLGQWIQQGARYEKHWAFEPLREKSDAPIDIDSMLKRELAKHGLTQNELADPVTQIRRLAFTLTGLPPNQSEVDSFTSDPSLANYQRLADAYLASPHYGEEMAKHWLDVARYGDTHGLHLDNERQAWAYRDWVVNAFNQNMPFSQFTIEQLAGDLLPNPTQSQLVATGFNRSNVTTSEGGAIDDEFLYRYAVDRTSTTIQAWLGLTGGCAVCHDHKYDPLTTREFYSMYAFFYSAADPAMDGNTNTTRPFLPIPTEQQKSDLERAIDKEKKSLAKLQQLASAPLQIAAETQKTTVLPEKSPMSILWLDDEFPIGASLRNTSRNDAAWSNDVGSPMGMRSLRQEFGHKYEQVISGGLVPKWIPEEGRLAAWIRTDRNEPPKAVFIEVATDKGNRRFVWTNSSENARLVDANESRIIGKLPQPGRWTELSVSLSDLPAGTKVKELKLGLFGGVCHWDGVVCTGIQRPEDQLLSDANQWWTSIKGSNVPLATEELAKALKEGPESEIGKNNVEAVHTFFRTYLSDVAAPAVLIARRDWQIARVERAIIESQIPGTFIFNDRATPRDAFVMTRGQYDQKGEAVVPGTPAILPPLKLDSNRSRLNRLDLAKWIVSDENALPSRVTVNRFWQQVFGVGLVKTSDDFGSQGTPPSHPELLDRLALEFRSKGWDIKKFMRELVSTHAFRQAANVNQQSYDKDPENRFLARGPRIRLDAEQIRDNILAVSGLLNKQTGGPGFKGYQPRNIWEPVGYGDSNTRYYIQDHGDVLYRRSLYSFIKRTAPPPFMSNFDAPNRELFCTRRERSNTPLQALQLMNDVQYVEAARVLAESILRDKAITPEQRTEFAFRKVLSRTPTESERLAIQSAYEQFQIKFQVEIEDAKKLIRVGERPYDPLIPPSDLAAFTLVANLIMNLDETVTRN
jgi:hypothetical protein